MLFTTFLAAALVAQSPDTLKAVTVTADRGVVVSRTDTVSISNSISITDVLHKSPSLLINDAGGLAGLKTVSLRGMGSAHTAIYVDGVRVGNVQSGQTDLGMLGIENFSGAAVDYAQNSVSFHTARPQFTDGRRIGGRLAFKGGSFGTYMPSGRLDVKISDGISASANLAGNISKGNFPIADGLTRENNDFKQIKGGIDLFGIMNGGDWMAKAYYNGSDRGTPGSLDWPSTDRQTDRNGFVQGLFRKRFGTVYSLQASAKASRDKVFYKSEWGDSDFRQDELQLNTSHRFRVNGWLDLSAAADIQWDNLEATYYQASRTGVVGTAAAAFRAGIFSADIALEYDGTFDKDGIKLNVLSPSADFRLILGKGFDIAGFARRAFRAPTFNELYYPGYGNPELKSEDAWLTDLGIEWKLPREDAWSAYASVDGFLNILDNKISSAPSPENPGLWMPFNIGKVRSAGFDISAGTGYSSGPWKVSADCKYTFQSALDKTEGSASYGQQIAYVAKHSAALCGALGYGSWSLEPVWTIRAGRLDSYGEMPDWNTLDLTLSKTFTLGSSTLAASISARNISDNRYYLSTGYPMPGRSLIGGIQFKF